MAQHSHDDANVGADVVSADFGSAGVAFLIDPQGVPVTGGSVVLGRGDLRRTLLFDAATGTVSTL